MVKNLLDKLSVDAYNHEYLMKHYQEGGRFKLFSNVFFGKIFTMAKVNWLMLLFCIPAFAVIIFMAYRASNYGLYLPFSADLGLGYPVVGNLDIEYNRLIMLNTLLESLCLVPCIVFGFIGLAGAFNCIKYESLGFNVKVIKEFFKGVKNNFITYLWLGLINGLMYFALMMSINSYGVTDLPLAFKIVTIILTSLVMAFVLVMSFYIMTQAAVYDLSLGKMIKNAFWLTISFALQNILILIISVGPPVGLLLLASTSFIMQFISILLCAMAGFSYVVCVWTIFNHYLYGMLFTACLEKDSPKKKRKEKQRK